MSITIDLARHLLCEHLSAYLENLSSALRVDVSQALASEGKLLHRPASLLDGRWALLAFYLASDLQPGIEPDRVSDVALAIECVICATDLLDDVMDEDNTALLQALGIARTLNVALALLYLAQRMLLAHTRLDIECAALTGLLDTLQNAMLQATAGQQRDLLAERRLACELTQEECIEIASAKAGTLLGMACRLAAQCAGKSNDVVEQWTESGRLLGIAAQLDNDAHDLSQLLTSANNVDYRKSDLVRSKKTLPIVLAAHSLRATHMWDAEHIDSILRAFATLTGEVRDICTRALHEGILAAWGIALLYRERARDYLHALGAGRESASPILCLILGLTETLD